jgi:peptidoglycan/LPS O-acetylase OafA/YrhL
VIVACLPFIIEGISSLKTGSYTPPTSERLNYGFLDFGFFEWLRLATLTQVFWPVEQAGSLQDKFTMINAVYWTLAIEVQFYCVVAGCLAVSRKHFTKLMLGVAAVCSICLAAGMSSLSGLFIAFWPMFALGAILYFVLERGWSLEMTDNRLIQGSLVVLALSIVGLFFAGAANGIKPSFITFSVMFAIVLWLIRPVDSKVRDLQQRNVIGIFVKLSCSLGAMSYSLYLLHGKLQYLSMRAVRQIFNVNTIPYDFFVILVTCLLCWPFYLACELPFSQPPKKAGEKLVKDAVSN